MSFFPSLSSVHIHKDDFQLWLLSFWHVLRLHWASHFQSGYTSKERLFVQEVISVVDEYISSYQDVFHTTVPNLPSRSLTRHIAWGLDGTPNHMYST